jgi:hypothetical protein
VERAAREILESGTFAFVREAMDFDRLQEMFQPVD